MISWIMFATFISPVVWRIVLGVGVGADYPMSASVSSDRVSTRKRGTMLAYVFANQVCYPPISYSNPY